MGLNVEYYSVLKNLPEPTLGGSYVMKSPSKLELTIILAAVILAFLVVALFWGMNRGTSSASTSPSVALYVAPVAEATPASSVAEPTTATSVGLAKLKGSTTVKALILGDSVAESLGASNKNVSSWYSLVSTNLHTKYPGTLQWAFKTTSKATMTDALNALTEVTPDTDLIILCVGRNDWATLTTDAFKQKYEQFLTELKAKSPNVELFLVVEPPVKAIATNNQTFPYRQVILDISQAHQLPVIDAWTVFIKDPVPLTGLLADGVIPNDKGYGILAGEVVKKFEERLLITP